MEKIQSTNSILDPKSNNFWRQSPWLRDNLYLVILILFLSIAISFLVVYIVFFKGKNSNQADLQPIATVATTPLPTQVLEVMADWKTYRNEEYGYSIRYPSGWEVTKFVVSSSDKPIGAGETLLENELQKVNFTVDSFNNVPPWPKLFEVRVLRNTENYTLEEWAENYHVPLGVNPETNLAKLIADTSVSARSAKQFSVFQFDSNNIETVTIYNGLVYQLVYNDAPGNDTDYENSRRIYNQILSTFKFLDGSEEEKIVSAEYTYDCKVEVVTNKASYFVDTAYLKSGTGLTNCSGYDYAVVSPSGKYVAYQDISGGIDSMVKIYSVERKEAFQLYVYGTSTVYDMLFLPDDSLVVLNGYPEETYANVYDIALLFSDYPNDLDTQYKYFNDLNNHTKPLLLPTKGNYDTLFIEGENL